jgi:hypothetical protein
MAHYRGKDVEVDFASVDVSGDGRSVSYEETADTLDDTVYGADNRTKLASLLDGTGSLEALDITGAWATAWQGLAPGTTGTMDIFPEGNTSGKRKVSFIAIIKSRSLQMPYDDLATLSVSFEISGAVAETTV